MHPLKRQLAAARREVRRLLVVHGAARVLSVAVAVAAVLAFADFLLRFDDRGVRVLCSIALVAATTWAVLRYLLPAVRQPLRDVTLAAQIERRFDAIGDHLSSTIEFLDSAQDDPLAGSAELRRAAVTQAEAELRPLDWRKAIDRRPTIRAAAVALAVLAIGVAMLAARPADARIALARLFNPLSDAGWPPTNDLVLVHRVDHIAYGQPFEVEVKDRNGRLPDVVQIQYRDVGDGSAENSAPAIETGSMQRIGDLMVARREHVTRSFDYRARGGDDRRMAWMHVEVVEPPRIDSLAITLHPLAYTGWPTQTSERRIVALRGTGVEMSGKSNKPLRGATLHPPGGPSIAAKLSADGLAFTIPFAPTAAQPAFVVERSGPYWFDLRDRDGLSGGDTDRWDIEAIKDEPPAVSLADPAGDLLVTSAATVSVKLMAKDDLALHTVGLFYTRSDRTDLAEIALAPLLAGPDHVPAASAPVIAGTMRSDSRSFEFLWQLAPLNLQPGVNLMLSAVANDYAGQRTVSSPRRISIITAAEFEDHLAQRESVILNELTRLLALERESRQQTASIETQVDRVGRLAAGDVEQLRATELNQRQIRRGLVGSGEGVRGAVLADVQAIVQELSSNHVDNPAVLRRMQEIADRLGRLDQIELPAAEQSLTSALKAAEDTPRSASLSPAGRRSLADADRLQQTIADALASMLGQLSEWNSFRGLARQLDEIRRDQADLEKSAREIGATTLTTDIQDLSPQQQADLKKLGDRQADLARQLDQLTARMAEVAGQMSTTEPLSAQSLSDALDVARQKTPSAAMLAAADDVVQNLMGKALAQQTAAAAVLDEMLDILANRRDQELSRVVAKLREAEQQLAAIRAEQDALHRRLEQLADNPASSSEAARNAELSQLAQQQHELAQRIEQFTRELERLQAQQAADSTKQAASSMHESSRSAASASAAAASADQAVQQSSAAKQNLDDALRQLAQQRRQAEEDLAQQQLARLEDSLTGLIDSQQRAIQETERLEKVRNSDGELSRGELQSVVDLARQQQSMSTDTDALAERLIGAEPFQFVLHVAAQDMLRTAARLRDRDTGGAAQQLEQDVLHRMQELVGAMKDDQPQQPANKSGQSGAGQKSSGNVHSLAEVRLIRLMQDDLNRRTRRLDDAVRNGGAPSDAERQEFSELTAEQGRIAELMVKLAGGSGDNGSPSPKDANP